MSASGGIEAVDVDSLDEVQAPDILVACGDADSLKETAVQLRDAGAGTLVVTGRREDLDGVEADHFVHRRCDAPAILKSLLEVPS